MTVDLTRFNLHTPIDRSFFKISLCVKLASSPEKNGGGTSFVAFHPTMRQEVLGYIVQVSLAECFGIINKLSLVQRGDFQSGEFPALCSGH